MNEQRFHDLEVALRRHGVAVRHARRAVLEMADHYRQLVEDALARDEPLLEAQRRAHAILGTDRKIIEGFADRKELQSWSRRWPAGFLVAPLLCFLGLGFADMAGFIDLVRQAAKHFPHAPLPAAFSADINSILGAALLWALPIAVAVVFGLLGYLRGVALRWPVAGIILLCAFSALLNVSCEITPHWTGVVTAGVGISWRQLPRCLFHAGTTAALGLILLGWLNFRSLRDSAPID